ADEAATSKWLRYFKELGRPAWSLDLRKNIPDSLKKSIAALAPSSSHRMNYREARVAVVGAPNVGKSTFLNRLVGRRAAPVGGIPGITKGVSWFKGAGCIVADSPGILDPRSDAVTQRMLSWLSSSKGQVIGAWDDLARECVDYLRSRDIAPNVLAAWGIEPGGTSSEVLERIGRRLGKLLPGGDVDASAAGRAFIDAVASGKLGRFSLETPDSPAVREGCR
ncbi:MAG: 50S ribosome-binding GTPase, partial [Synergistaceae bacterium]|nr:50S ribosome-binding GTPase [Synergistaceae bacterium]